MRLESLLKRSRRTFGKMIFLGAYSASVSEIFSCWPVVERVISSTSGVEQHLPVNFIDVLLQAHVKICWETLDFLDFSCKVSSGDLASDQRSAQIAVYLWHASISSAE